MYRSRQNTRRMLPPSAEREGALRHIFKCSEPTINPRAFMEYVRTYREPATRCRPDGARTPSIHSPTPHFVSIARRAVWGRRSASEPNKRIPPKFAFINIKSWN